MQTNQFPILYSFRRCPYAIRARLAIRNVGVAVELREVVLRNKPDELLAVSPKATVPVLVLPDGRVVDESRDIMEWALAEGDIECWLAQPGEPWQAAADALIDENDFAFKPLLDRYKYADRFPEYPAETYRAEACGFLEKLEHRLNRHDYLMSDRMTLADIAIFPFIRQFAHVDKVWFDATSFGHLQQWLACLLESDLFMSVMSKYPQWQAGDPPLMFP